jgi:hypothetical protein
MQQNDPIASENLENPVSTLTWQRKFKSAEAHMREVVKLSTDSLSDELNLLNDQFGLAWILQCKARIEKQDIARSNAFLFEAETIARKVLHRQEEMSGTQHLSTSDGHKALAAIINKTGSPETAHAYALRPC